jgi:hypothetical protein
MDSKAAAVEMIDVEFSMLELIGWRLHWVYCDLDNLLSEEKRACKIKSFDDLEAFRRAFDKKLDQIGRIVWEFETISGVGTSKMSRLVRNHPKMKIVTETRDKTIAFMRQQYKWLEKNQKSKTLGVYIEPEEDNVD